MSFGSKILGFGGFANRESSFPVDNSCMFDAGNSAYMYRTPSSAGNRDRWTFSCWIKRSNIAVSAETAIFGSYTDANNRDVLRFKATDELEFQLVSGGTTYSKKSVAKYRDPSAWYHIVAVYDSANATADHRIRLYINGSEITNSTGTDPASGTDSSINNTVKHYIGARSSDGNPSLYWHGYMSEVHFIDGTVLTPNDFGETDSDTGQWVAKKVSGVAYGTNGFYLKFKDAYPGNITATGGTITTSGDYKIHTFNSSGTFTVTNISGGDAAIDYLVIAGGGGGGYSYGGGGGAGGYRTSYNSTSGGGCGPETRVQVAAQAYTITVGAGTSGMSSNVNPTNGNGNASSIAGSGFTTISCVGGGGGGHYSLSNSESWGGDGAAGGSGGGVGTTDDGNDADPGAGTACQGYAGGPMRNNATSGGAAGGGGSGGVGYPDNLSIGCL